MVSTLAHCFVITPLNMSDGCTLQNRWSGMWCECNSSPTISSTSKLWAVWSVITKSIYFQIPCHLQLAKPQGLLAWDLLVSVSFLKKYSWSGDICIFHLYCDALNWRRTSTLFLWAIFRVCYSGHSIWSHNFTYNVIQHHWLYAFASHSYVGRVSRSMTSNSLWNFQVLPNILFPNVKTAPWACFSDMR